MTWVDKLLALAQVSFAFLFTLGFFSILFLLMYLHKDMSTTEVTILTGLVSVLGTLLTQQMMFFFARTRPPAIPDPTTTTTTVNSSSTTTPTPLIVPANTALSTAPAPPVVITPIEPETHT